MTAFGIFVQKVLETNLNVGTKERKKAENVKYRRF